MARSTTAKRISPSVKALDIKPGDRAAAIKAADGKATQDIKMIPIGEIKVLPGLQPRLTDEKGYDEGVEEIVKSIVDLGFMRDKPLTVFSSIDDEGENVIYVADGHGRLEAARRAVAREVEIEALPCVFVDIEDSPWFDAALQRRNMTQRVLSPMAQAVHVRRALAAGKSADETAAMLNITKRYVYDLDLLAKAPKAVREAVKAGDVKAYKAVQLLRKAEKDGDVEQATAVVVNLAAEKAARAKAKADAKENGTAPPPAAQKVKRIRWSDTLQLEAGGEVEKEQMDMYAGFFDEDVWASLVAPARSKKRYKVLKNAKLRISIVRDADDENSDVPEAEEDDGLGAATEPRKVGRKGGGRRGSAPTAEDADAAAAPDISRIADPA